MKTNKITYKKITKVVWETDQNSIKFMVKINNKEVYGWWITNSQYTMDGVDINELSVKNDCFANTIKIFKDGGSRRTYEISARDFPLKEKQPRSLRFTGRKASVDQLKSIFINKIRDGIENIGVEGQAQLSEEFIKYFNIN